MTMKNTIKIKSSTVLMVILYFATTLYTYGQERKNLPTPVFSETSIGFMEEATGWTYSKDGKWLWAENSTPFYRFSYKENVMKDKRNQLGLDNFLRLELKYLYMGKDTLVILYKSYNYGTYKYETTLKGWNEKIGAFYYVFKSSELEKIKKIKDGQINQVKIKIYDAGNVKNIKSEKKVEESIAQKIFLKSDFEKELILHIAPYKEKNVVQFHIYTLHKIFKLAEGIQIDHRIKNSSVFGYDRLFDNTYYETDYDTFNQFIELEGYLSPEEREAAAAENEAADTKDDE